jgi:hypothetical protein
MFDPVERNRRITEGMRAGLSYRRIGLTLEPPVSSTAVLYWVRRTPTLRRLRATLATSEAGQLREYRRQLIAIRREVKQLDRAVARTIEHLTDELDAFQVDLAVIEGGR